MDGWEFQLCKITPFVRLLSLCVCVCVRACVRACVRVCVCVCSGGGGGAGIAQWLRSVGLVIDRSRDRTIAGTAGEFYSQWSAFCADSKHWFTTSFFQPLLYLVTP